MNAQEIPSSLSGRFHLSLKWKQYFSMSSLVLVILIYLSQEILIDGKNMAVLGYESLATGSAILIYIQWLGSLNSFLYEGAAKIPNLA